MLFRSHLTPLEWASSENLQTTNAGEGVEKREPSCTPMFIAALFTIARSWKQPKCPSTDKWIKKLWYVYTKEYYSAIKRNEIESFV